MNQVRSDRDQPKSEKNRGALRRQDRAPRTPVIVPHPMASVKQITPLAASFLVTLGAAPLSAVVVHSKIHLFLYFPVLPNCSPLGIVLRQILPWLEFMKIVAIVQARFASRRLPGKVLMDLAGRPLLWRQLERVARMRVDEIVVATTDQPEDDEVAALAVRFGAECYRGDSHDVLKRFLGAARQASADVVVRLAGDCPLLDPLVANQVIRELVDNLSSCDYASNILERTFPRGLDTEAFTFGALSWMDRLSKGPEEREQVTLLPRGRLRHMFLCRSVEDAQDNSDLCWAVRTADELESVRRIYQDLDLVSRHVAHHEIVAYVRTSPHFHRPSSPSSTPNPHRTAA